MTNFSKSDSVLYKAYRISYYILAKRHFYGLTSPLRVLPDLIVIGVVRGGTTSLYHYLKQHKCIVPSAYDEIGFFDDNYHLGLNWYRSMFPTKFTKNRILKKYGKFVTYEVTPFYIYNPRVAKRILTLLPNVKLIAVLRNPVDRAYSNYQLGVRGGKEVRPFNEVVKLEMEFIEKNSDIIRGDDYFEKIVAKSYVARGFYAKQLRLWMDLFPKDHLLVISSEDLASRTKESLTSIFEFLQLPNYEVKDLTKQNEAKYQSMNSDIRKVLVDYFRPHNEDLYSMINRRFDWDK